MTEDEKQKIMEISSICLSGYQELFKRFWWSGKYLLIIDGGTGLGKTYSVREFARFHFAQKWEASKSKEHPGFIFFMTERINTVQQTYQDCINDEVLAGYVLLLRSHKDMVLYWQDDEFKQKYGLYGLDLLKNLFKCLEDKILKSGNIEEWEQFQEKNGKGKTEWFIDRLELHIRKLKNPVRIERTEDILEVINECYNKLKRYLRKYLKFAYQDEIKQKGKKELKKAVKEYIYCPNHFLHPILFLFPEVRMCYEENLLIFLTAQKAYYPISTLFEFFTLTELKKTVIFIDEADSVRDALADQIKKEAARKINLLDAIEQLKAAADIVIREKLDKRYYEQPQKEKTDADTKSQNASEDAAESPKTLKDHAAEFLALYREMEQFYLPIRTVTAEKRKHSFMFSENFSLEDSKSWDGVVKGNNEYLVIEEEQDGRMFLREDGSTAFQTRLCRRQVRDDIWTDGVYLDVVIRKLERILWKGLTLLRQVKVQEMRIHGYQMQEIDLEQDRSFAKSVIDKLLGQSMSEELRSFFHQMIIKIGGRTKRNLKDYHDFYAYGCSLSLFQQSDFDSFGIDLYQILDTPEAFLLEAVKNENKVILMSATMGLHSPYSNFPLNYEPLREKEYQLSEAECAEIIEYAASRYQYQETISSQICSRNTNDYMNSADSVCRYLQEKKFVTDSEVLAHVGFLMAACVGFREDIYAALFEWEGVPLLTAELIRTVTDYVKNTEMTYILDRAEKCFASCSYALNQGGYAHLAFLNIVLKREENGLSDVSRKTKELLDRLFAQYDSCRDIFGTSSIQVYYANASNISQTQKEAEEKLRQGKKVALITSYPSAMKGLNLQLSITKEQIEMDSSALTALNEYGKKQIEALLCGDAVQIAVDFDSIYLEHATNNYPTIRTESASVSERMQDLLKAIWLLYAAGQQTNGNGKAFLSEEEKRTALRKLLNLDLGKVDQIDWFNKTECKNWCPLANAGRADYYYRQAIGRLSRTSVKRPLIQICLDGDILNKNPDMQDSLAAYYQVFPVTEYQRAVQSPEVKGYLDYVSSSLREGKSLQGIQELSDDGITKAVQRFEGICIAGQEDSIEISNTLLNAVNHGRGYKRKAIIEEINQYMKNADDEVKHAFYIRIPKSLRKLLNGRFAGYYYKSISSAEEEQQIKEGSMRIIGLHEPPQRLSQYREVSLAHLKYVIAYESSFTQKALQDFGMFGFSDTWDEKEEDCYPHILTPKGYELLIGNIGEAMAKEYMMRLLSITKEEIFPLENKIYEKADFLIDMGSCCMAVDAKLRYNPAYQKSESKKIERNGENIERQKAGEKAAAIRRFVKKPVLYLTLNMRGSKEEDSYLRVTSLEFTAKDVALMNSPVCLDEEGQINRTVMKELEHKIKNEFLKRYQKQHSNDERRLHGYSVKAEYQPD